MIVGLWIVTVVLGIAFLLVERSAPEPAMPLRLFRIRTVALSSVVLFLVGVCMFGAVTYQPTFLQIANGASASNAGLLLVPLMFGILGSSILAGQIISRTGRYRIFPILGMATRPWACTCCRRFGVGSARFESGAYMAILGIGIGMVMQILVLAVQNEAPIEDLGVATSTVGFFRAVGGSVGVAAFGALFTSRITALLGAKADLHITPEVVLLGMAPSARQPRWPSPKPSPRVRRSPCRCCCSGFVLACFIKEAPLRYVLGRRSSRRGPRSELCGGARSSASPDPSPRSGQRRDRRQRAGRTTIPFRHGAGAVRRGHHRDPGTARAEEGGGARRARVGKRCASPGELGLIGSRSTTYHECCGCVARAPFFNHLNVQGRARSSAAAESSIARRGARSWLDRQRSSDRRCGQRSSSADRTGRSDDWLIRHRLVGRYPRSASATPQRLATVERTSWYARSRRTKLDADASTPIPQ